MNTPPYGVVAAFQPSREFGRVLAACYELRPLSLYLAPWFTRHTTVVRLCPETTIQPTSARLERYPGMRLKVMPTAGWDDQFVRDLAATSAVDVIDLPPPWLGVSMHCSLVGWMSPSVRSWRGGWRSGRGRRGGGSGRWWASRSGRLVVGRRGAIVDMRVRPAGRR